MEINSNVWVREIQKESVPKFPCACGGNYVLIPNGFESWNNAETEVCYNEDWFEIPYHIALHFFMKMKCDDCGELAVASGVGRIECYQNDWFTNEYVELFSIKNFFPAPVVVSLSKHFPSDVKEIIFGSFPLYWVDAASCANKIRLAIEVLLEGEPFSIKRQGTLHERINKISDVKWKDLLMAIKWLGNTGSHENEIEKIDLLSAYELIIHLDDELFRKPGEADFIKRKVSGLLNKHDPKNK